MPPGNRDGRLSGLLIGLAGAWGLAEATLFFIVPDVLLTLIALLVADQQPRRGLRIALAACLVAALGAAAGGALMVTLAASHPEMTTRMLLGVPGISGATFEKVGHLLGGGQIAGMLQGAFLGVPYKVFAAETGLSVMAFVVATPLVRLPRFVLAVLAAWAFARVTRARLKRPARLIVWLAFWCIFYGFYFRAVGW